LWNGCAKSRNKPAMRSTSTPQSTIVDGQPNARSLSGSSFPVVLSPPDPDTTFPGAPPLSGTSRIANGIGMVGVPRLVLLVHFELSGVGRQPDVDFHFLLIVERPRHRRKPRHTPARTPGLIPGMFIMPAIGFASLMIGVAVHSLICLPPPKEPSRSPVD